MNRNTLAIAGAVLLFCAGVFLSNRIQSLFSWISSFHVKATIAVCTLDQIAVLHTADISQSANSQLQASQDSIRQALTTRKASLQNQARVLDADRAKIGEDAYQSRSADLVNEARQTQATFEDQTKKLEASRDDATNKVMALENAILGDSLRHAGCSIVLQKGIVFGPNVGADLTQDVIAKMNASGQTISIDNP